VPAASGFAAVVRAQSIFGAMHGLESLTQLVDVRVGAGAPTTIPSAPVEVHDRPRFSFRGLMIEWALHASSADHAAACSCCLSPVTLRARVCRDFDDLTPPWGGFDAPLLVARRRSSGRHFLPISHVKKTVVAASMAKLNVIHWHLVDSQSFATCSEKFPALCAMGAYPNAYSARNFESSPSRNVSKAQYSPAELRDLVTFAKSHGVRIQVWLHWLENTYDIRE
jgi:N-acetyl-beta-hexosaminidase